MLTTEYELFRMKDNESIQDMHTRFTSIINELHSLGDVIPRNKLVRKILSVLPGSWESKVNAITEAKDLQTLTMDELIGNLKTYEMKRKKYSKRREPKKEKNLVLKVENSDSSEEDSDMAYLTKRFQKMEQYKQNPNKAAKRNPIPDKQFIRKSATDNIVNQALAAWEDSSSESKREPDAENSFMMASDDDEEDENDEVNFRDVQRNLKSYSSKKLRSLANVLIDPYYSLINDKKILTIEIGDAEQSIDDLVLQAELKIVKIDLEKSLKWTWSSNVVTTMYFNNSGNKQGIGFQKEKTPYNPHSKYITVSDNWLCTHYGNSGHFKENFQAKVQSVQKNKSFTKKVTTKEGPAKVYKVCNKRAQCVEESGHELFNKTPSSNKGGNSKDQDNEPLLVLGKYLMFQMAKISSPKALSEEHFERNRVKLALLKLN
ncbi:uncharacterized protein [Nicotiana sylvestris]|uniref:uncharacterized protein n=1 Tax=Nicotiana sylvestris TaxID=4096 RepID=UPI00388C9421